MTSAHAARAPALLKPGAIEETPPRTLRHGRRMPWLLVLGAALAVGLVLVAALAGMLAPFDPNQSFAGQSLEAPGATFPLGSDSIGRDVLSRTMHGSRVTLLVVVPAIALAVAAGLVLGLVAGYRGGWADQLIMRVLDVVFAFPVILLAIAIVAVLGPSVPNLVLTIGLIYTPSMARVVRGPVLSVKRLEYVEAGRALGAGGVGLVVRHVLPNILPPVIVETSLALSRAIFTETALSFLGLGPPPPNPTWGSMLAQSRQFMEFAPWTVIVPGSAIALATMAFLLMGNGLRDYLDPRRAW